MDTPEIPKPGQNPISTVMALTHDPLKAFENVKNGSWVTPALALIAAVGYMATMPTRNPAELLVRLKWWGIMQVVAVVAIFLAGFPAGGRGTVSQIVKVVAFLTLADGAAVFFLRTVQTLPHVYDTLLMLLPVLFYLAIKAVHEFQNDNMCFRVTASAFIIWRILMLLAVNYLGASPGTSLFTLLQ